MDRECHNNLSFRLWFIICVNFKLWLGWGGSREKVVDYPKLKGLILWKPWMLSLDFIAIFILECVSLNIKMKNSSSYFHSKFHGNLASSHWTINQHSNPPTNIVILITVSTRAKHTLLQVYDICKFSAFLTKVCTLAILINPNSNIWRKWHRGGMWAFMD